MNQLILNAFLILILFSVSACQFKSPDNWLGEVNGVYITQDDFDVALKGYSNDVQAQFRDNPDALLTQLINQELLYQHAKMEGFEENDEFIQQVTELNRQLDIAKRQLLINLLLNQTVFNEISVSDTDISQFYEENKAQFQAFQQRKARHVLVKTGKEALEVYNKAVANQDFSELAKRYSIDPTSKNGGDLGWFRKGQLVPEFEKAVFKLPRKGSISRVVKTQFGYHVIKLDDIKDVPSTSLDSATDRIRTYILNQRQVATLQGFIADIKKEHNVTRNSENEVGNENPVSQVDAETP